MANAERADRAPAGSRYQDQRRYVVADSLDELKGPTHGVVALDQRLDWSGWPVYDLDEARGLASMYETIMREASRQDDLRRWLHGTTLIRLWHELWLSPQIRQLWEARFPELSAARKRAAS